METKSKSKPSFKAFAFNRSLSDCLYYLACAISFCSDDSIRSVLVECHDGIVKTINVSK